MRILAVLILLCGELSAQEDFIPCKKGRKWVYKQGDSEFVQTVTGSEKIGGTECFLFESEMVEKKECMWLAQVADGVWLYRVRSGETTWDLPKPALLLKYPLKQGDKWDARVPMGDIAIEYQFENGGQEEVEVPAGKYSAWVVKMKGTAAGQEFSGAYWYVKGVGNVKQKTTSKRGEFLLELKEAK